MLPERRPSHGPWYAEGGPLDGQAIVIPETEDGDEHVYTRRDVRHFYEFRDCVLGRPSAWVYLGSSPVSDAPA